VQSFVLADHVYVDTRTGKKVIAGTFNQVNLAEGDVRLPREVAAYLALTNCRGHVELQLRHIDLAGDTVLLKTGIIKIDAEDPLHVYEVVAHIPPLPLPHPGIYALEVYCNDQCVGGLRIHAVRRSAAGPGQAGPA